MPRWLFRSPPSGARLWAMDRGGPGELSQHRVKYGGRPDEAFLLSSTWGGDAETGNGHPRLGSGQRLRLTSAQIGQLFTLFERLRNVRAEGHGPACPSCVVFWRSSRESWRDE